MPRDIENYKRWCREYRKKNIDKFRERDRAKYRKFRDKILAKFRERYRNDEEFREKYKEKRRLYRIKNREVLRKKDRERYWNDHLGRRTKMLERKRKTYLQLRFQILQRDNFTCQYCGRKAPEIVLQIDHKQPKSKGGENKIDNYITACKDCNLGKRDILLDIRK